MRLLIPIAAVLLTLSSVPYHDYRGNVEYYPCESVGPEYAAHSLPLLTDSKSSAVHRASSIASIPPYYLAAISYAETICGSDMAHSDQWDVSEFGLHERPGYHRERVRKWGEYDAYRYEEAARIAALELAEELNHWPTVALAFSAYTNGQRGTRRHGIDTKYVARVQQYLDMIDISVYSE